MNLTTTPPPKKKELCNENEPYLFIILLWLRYVQFGLSDEFKTVNTGFDS